MMPDPVVWRALAWIAPLRAPPRGCMLVVALPSLEKHWPAQIVEPVLFISGYTSSSTLRVESADPLGKPAYVRI